MRMAGKKSPEMDDNSLILAPEGDVILVVGGKKFSIRVDSLFLKRHSPVFAAMFGQNFGEGQDLSSSSPKEITLPDDDPDAMVAICATMYHASRDIPQDPTTGFVLCIIRHADKYDCYGAVALPSQAFGWLEFDHLTDGQDLVNLLAASYLLRDKEVFTNISKALVTKYNGSYADLANDVICDVLPWKTFCRLEELRARMQILAAGILFSPVAIRNLNSSLNRHSSSCVHLAMKLHYSFEDNLSVAYRSAGPGCHSGSDKKSRDPPTTWQPAIGPLIERMCELTKACEECKKNVENSKLDTFGLSLAGSDLSQIAMLPEFYWGSKLTSEEEKA